MNKTTITLPDILFFSICLSSGCKPQEAPQSGQAAARLGKTNVDPQTPPQLPPICPQAPWKPMAGTAFRLFNSRGTRFGCWARQAASSSAGTG